MQLTPVCKMKVNPATTAGSFKHEGTDYYFCNIRCRDKFSAAPDQFLSPTSNSPSALPVVKSEPVVHSGGPAVRTRRNSRSGGEDDNGNMFLVDKHETRRRCRGIIAKTLTDRRAQTDLLGARTRREN